jgi:hypothetical protein
LVNYLYKKFQNTNTPPHIWAFVIKAIHFTIGYFTNLIYIFAPLGFSIFTLVVSLCFWSLFLYLKGCFLSNIEYKLDKHNFINIIDPYLVMFNYPINDETRHTGTWYIVSIYFSFAFAIIYFRLKMRNFIKN